MGCRCVDYIARFAQILERSGQGQSKYFRDFEQRESHSGTPPLVGDLFAVDGKGLTELLNEDVIRGR